MCPFIWYFTLLNAYIWVVYDKKLVVKIHYYEIEQCAQNIDTKIILGAVVNDTTEKVHDMIIL